MSTSRPPFAIAAYLGVVQFFFALGWTVYVIFLTELLGRAGIDRRWTPWILALDQAIFALADFAIGIAMDRARAGLRRIGGVLIGFTAVASVAMLLMPATTGFGAPVFLSITLIWVCTSAALRAPPYALIGRYAATSSVPSLAGLMLLGMAVASAMGPYLGLILKGIDPQLPFAAASAAILLSCIGLVAAERRLIEAKIEPPAPAMPLPWYSPTAAALLLALLLAVFGFQVQSAINAAAQIKRVVDPSLLPWFMPIFWAGFAFGFLPAEALGRRLGHARTTGVACIAGALALASAAHASSSTNLILAHAGAGFAWAVALCNAFALAAACGHHGAEGRYTGALLSLIALGTLARIAFSLSGTPQASPAASDWIPVAAWSGSAALLLIFWRRLR